MVDAQKLKVDLTDVNLFGNDAAELEDETVFWSYALELPELKALANPSNQLQILRA